MSILLIIIFGYELVEDDMEHTYNLKCLNCLNHVELAELRLAKRHKRELEEITYFKRLQRCLEL
jgi:hypothetical protein